MTDTIIQSFDIWANAQGIKSKNRVKSIDNISLEGVLHLRELILDLAIRGKLVQQDSKEEPVSKLVKKIEWKKEKLFEEGKIKKEKPLPKITEKEIPFKIPESWHWVRLGSITNKIGSGSTPRGGSNAYTTSGIIFLRSQNIRNEGLLLDDVAYISTETNERMSNTTVEPNDILLNITGGSLGRSTIFPKEIKLANVSQHVTIIRPTVVDSSSYIHRCILSPYIQNLIWGRQIGANREGLSKKVLELFEIPYPPLSEQKRIVIKVDELMALCDKLEEEQTNNLKTHQTLVKVLLETLTQAKDADELQTAWQRMLPHFDTLFCTEDSIDQLKQTILQLAIMGRLVKQEPNDEPAITLLKRIKAEKEKLIKAGDLKNEKLLPQITGAETPFELPEGWVWSRLEEITKNVDYGTSEKADVIGDIPVLRMGNIQNEKVILNNLKYVEKTIADLPRLFLKKRDLIFNRTNSFELVGKCGIFEGEEDEYTFASYLIRVSVVKELVSIDYINSYINSKICRTTQIEPQITQQTGQANFSGSKLKNILFPLPPIAEQQRIVTKVNELFELCDSLKIRIQVAQEIKVSLSKTIIENALV